MPLHIGGKTVSWWWVIGGAAGVGGVIYFIRRSSASSAAASGTSSSSIDPVTGLPYSMDDQTDPATGLTYLQEAQEYGSVSAAEAAVSSDYYASETSAGDTGTLDAGYPTIYPSETSSTSGSYSTNAAWSQAVTEGLANLGWSATDVSTALGMYLAGMPLTTLADGASSLAIVQAAVAEFGPPPVGTYSIIAPSSSSGAVGTTTGGSSSTGTGSSGTSGGSSSGSSSSGSASSGSTGTTTTPAPPATVTGQQSSPVPNVTGKTLAQAETTLNSYGFLARTGGGQPITAPSTGKVLSQTPAPGTRITSGSGYWPSGTAQPFVDLDVS